MSLPEKTFNGVVAAMKMISRVEPASEEILKAERVHRLQLDETLSYPALKVLTRSDAKERVRIVQKGPNFGAVVDFDDPTCGWSAERIIAGGFVYESVAIAETQARASLSWLKDSNQAPNSERST